METRALESVEIALLLILAIVDFRHCSTFEVLSLGLSLPVESYVLKEAWELNLFYLKNLTDHYIQKSVQKMQMSALG